jgi:hypothetical protein
MSIRPVDFQMLVPKVNERVRVQNEDQQRQISQQQQQALAADHTAEEHTSLVHTQEDAQKAQIAEKESEKQKRRRKASAKDDEDENKNKPTTRKPIQPNEGRTIDIRL